MAFTFFFRDKQTLDLISEHLIPTITGNRETYIWDAGCAMGPEPYSLAIVLAESMGRYAFKKLKVDATDLDPTDQFGKIITEGSYPVDQVKRMPKPILEKYFHPDSEKKHYRIDDLIRNRVVFQKHDLLSLKPTRDNYSLIVCKNVLLHLQYAERVDVIKMFHRSLKTGGFLAMEHTQKMPEELASQFTQVTRSAQLYRKG